MKTADEITKLSEEALEMIASDNSVPVPGNLADSLDAAIIASELGRTRRRVSGVGRICVAAGFAAASPFSAPSKTARHLLAEQAPPRRLTGGPQGSPPGVSPGVRPRAPRLRA